MVQCTTGDQCSAGSVSIPARVRVCARVMRRRVAFPMRAGVLFVSGTVWCALHCSVFVWCLLVWCSGAFLLIRARVMFVNVVFVGACLFLCSVFLVFHFVFGDRFW